MAFPCPICGGVAHIRSSRMLSTTTKETYYNCRNDECCHQFKTLEGDPVTLAVPTNLPVVSLKECVSKKSKLIKINSGQLVHLIDG